MKARMAAIVAVTMLIAGTAQARPAVADGSTGAEAAGRDPELELEPGPGEWSGEILGMPVHVFVGEDGHSGLELAQATPPASVAEAFGRGALGSGLLLAQSAPSAPTPAAPAPAQRRAAPRAPAAPQPPAAPAPAAPRLEGKLPAPIRNVSIDADDEHIGDILAEIVDSAGLNIMIAAPRSLVRQRLTIKLNNTPADQALESVLEVSQLRAEVKGNLVMIRPMAGAPDDLGSAIAERVLERTNRHGRVKDDEIVIFGQPLEVKAGETVQQAVVVGGPLSVYGHVLEDAVAIGGPVSVHPGAEVDGDVVSIGGPVQVMEGAIVKGDKVALSGPLGSIGGIMGTLGRGDLTPGIEHAFGWTYTVIRYLTLLVVALLLIAFVPERVQRVRRFLVARPGASTLAGFAMLVGFLPLCILLIVTLIGIPLIPVAFFLLLAFLVMGLTSFLVLLGDRLPVLRGRKGIVAQMLIGLVLLFLIDLLPFVGTLFVAVVSFIAGGAALLSRFGGEPKTTAAPEAQLPAA